ncbi:MAG TPA: LuxR C-terminal-related transcriptional regulator, partial [Ktedonobacterales bacterium]|nr:LuxR C-terminal-related transcriptional regulator [Ktedonobacterales bacterium]
SQWQQQPTCWLALDERDNDLARFWRYLIATLRLHYPQLGFSMTAPFDANQIQIDALLAELIDVLAGSARDLVVVLDDYHLITSPAIHESLTYMLEHLPPQLHMVIASRTEPPLPLARLRARGALEVLQSADLRFTLTETTAYLRQAMGLRLTAEQIEALTDRTEGWIAGLHLAVLSLHECVDIPAVIASFGGNHRYIFDYLAEEVLRHQPEAVQRFLMQTAILERLNAPLCAAVTKQESCQTMLERLERDNLFITALDDERHWYRYHALFADFLRERLRQSHSEIIPDLHTRAANWYEQAGQMAETIEHALAGCNFAYAATLMETQNEPMLKRGECVTLQRWLDALPEEILLKHPQLCFFHAGILSSVGRAETAEQRLQALERALDDPSGLFGMIGHDEARTLRSEITATRATIAAFQGDVPRTLDLTRQALAELPEDNLLVKSILAASGAAAYYWNGDIPSADRAFGESFILGQQARIAHTMLGSLCGQAFVRVVQGRLHEGASMHRQALALGRDENGNLAPILSLAYCGLGELEHEWNHLDAAISYFEQGHVLGQKWGDLRSLFHSYLWQSRTTYFREGPEAAHAVLDDIERRARQSRIPEILHWSAAARAWIARLQGDLDVATHWMTVAGEETGAGMVLPRRLITLMQVRVLLAQGQADTALHLIALLLESAQSAGANRNIIELLMLRALAHQVRHDLPAALHTLEDALILAKPEGYIRTFIDEGAPLVALLDQLATASCTTSDIAPLLAYIGRLLNAAGRADPAFDCQPPLPEPLHERELSVLRLLAIGKSNDEIAKDLILAVTTVKWYIKHLYRKLDVHSRTQAIARARQMGLLA